MDFSGVDTFTYTLMDDEGEISAATVTVTVAAVNDEPFNTVPGAQTVDEDTALIFTGANVVSISDPDANGLPIEVTLNASNGTIDLNGIGDVQE